MSNDLGLDFEIVSNALREISSDFKYPLTIQKTKTGQSNPTFIVEGKNRRKLDKQKKQ